jgi:hypothetical protein
MENEPSAFPIAPTPKPTAYDLETEKLRAEPGGFGEWLERNPPPHIGELLKLYGRFDMIPRQAWAEHDMAMQDWRRAYRLRNATAQAPKVSR